ncbi:hypothetical protein BKA57DRAFT_491424, partial [Linnemannia elongata]
MRHSITSQSQHSQQPQQQPLQLQQQFPQQQQQHLQNQQAYQPIPLTQQSLAQQQLLQQQQQQLQHQQNQSQQIHQQLQQPQQHHHSNQQQQQQQHQVPLLTQHNGRPLLAAPLPVQSGYPSYTTARSGSETILPLQQQQQQQVQESEHYSSVMPPHTHTHHELQPSSNQYPNLLDPIPSQQLQQTRQASPHKQKYISHYGQRFNPMYPSPTSSATTPLLSHASLSSSDPSDCLVHHSTVTSLPVTGADTSAAASAVAAAARLVTRQSLTPQVSPHLNPARASHDNLTPAWSPAHASTSPSSTASMPAYLDTFESKYGSGPVSDLSNPLTMSNLYARSLHTPFYQDMANGVHLGFGSQA